jgi:hypothetical protein
VANDLAFDQFVQQTLADYAVAGAIIAVASADGTVLVKDYDVRERDRPAAIGRDTRLRIASMRKSSPPPRSARWSTRLVCSPFAASLLALDTLGGDRFRRPRPTV